MNWEEDEEIEKDEQTQKKQKHLDDDDSGDEKRKVRSPKEKLKDLIKEKYQKIKDAHLNHNFVIIHDSIEELLKHFDKALQLFQKEEFPILFLEALCICEESLNLSKEEQKNLKKEYNTAFNSIKKLFAKNAKKTEELLKNYKEKRPTKEELEKEEESEEEIDDKKSEESDNEIADTKIDIIAMMKMDEDKEPAERRLKWVKKEKKVVAEKDKEKEDEEKEEKKKQRKNIKNQNVHNKFYEEESPVQKVEEIITDDKIEKECEEISNQRGQSKRPIEIVSRLDYLFTKTQNISLKIKLTSLSILICFDASPGQFSSISIELWDKIYNSILSLISFLDELTTNSSLEKEKKDNISSMMQNNLISLLEKLEMELYKSLQFTDNNSREYLSRVKDEMRFLLLCRKVEAFYSKSKNNSAIARCYLLILKHLYYKNETMINAIIQKFNIKVDKDDYLLKSIESPIDLVKKLCHKIYENLDEKSKLKATLYNIYFYSVHNDFIDAKNLFNMSFSFELISTFKDEQLKTLFNRTLAEMGLSAFRCGKMQESLLFLSPLCSNGTTKLKEYLCQSYTKESEKSILFVDKEDKKRTIPHLMQFNIDEIESVFYISSMVVDTPYILLNKLGSARHIKRYGNFYSRVLVNFDKQIFNGPPETNKERILCASYHILKGDWKKCLSEINQVKVFTKLKNYNEIKQMIEENVKITALKCYLIFYIKEYKAFDINGLAKRFEIEKGKIKKIINDMIYDEEIQAKWRGEILKIKNDDRDTSKMMKKLVDNVNVISKQNVDLLEIAASCNKIKDD